MSELERYVAYYRMPVVGDLFGGEQVEDQRREVATYLSHTGGELVGEFTEVLRPAFEGETSPAFDLGLTCCLDFNAKLICALTRSDLAPTEKEKAADANIELLLITETVECSEISSGNASIAPPAPYLHLDRNRKNFRLFQIRENGKAKPAGNLTKADRFSTALLPVIDQIRDGDASSLSEIAEGLNERNIRTARGQRWHPSTVKDLLERR